MYNDYQYKDIKLKNEELAELTHKKEKLNHKDNSIKFIDLFCGIGGIRQSFEDNGFECVFSCDNNHYSQTTYYNNYGVVPFGDITKIPTDDIPDHDVLCAGFPCQPFSIIGRREGFKHPTQGTMFYEIIRIIQDKKPKIVFLENVKGLVHHESGKTLDTIIQSLEDLNYSVSYDILNSINFGVPQSRERFFLVAILKDENKDIEKFTFPKNNGSPMINIGSILEKNVEGFSISKHLQKYLFKVDDGNPQIVDENTLGAAKTLVASYYKVQRKTGTFVSDGETGIRYLSQKECARLMGFPDDFNITVSRMQMFKQFGNSVVIPVVFSIAKEIKKMFK